MLGLILAPHSVRFSIRFTGYLGSSSCPSLMPRVLYRPVALGIRVILAIEYDGEREPLSLQYRSLLHPRDLSGWGRRHRTMHILSSSGRCYETLGLTMESVCSQNSSSIYIQLLATRFRFAPSHVPLQVTPTEHPFRHRAYHDVRVSCSLSISISYCEGCEQTLFALPVGASLKRHLLWQTG